MKHRICILADYPAWLLPEMDHLPSRTSHATWLHMLRPYYEAITDEYEIHWIVMTKGIDAPVELLVDNQVFHLLPRKRHIVAMLTAYLFESSQIRRLLADLHPSLIHAWGTEDAYALTVARIKEWKSLFSIQGCITEWLRTGSSGILPRLLGYYERYAVRRINDATGESERAVNNLLAINADLRVHIVEYGVSEVFHTVKRNLSQSPCICFVGSVARAKGIFELIEVMSRPSLSGINLVILGCGADQERLHHIASPNVTFFGHATRQQVLDTFSTTWALAIPTHCDTGPTVVKEARAAGVPVITTTAAGAARYVEEGLSGYVISRGDTDALEKSILSICESRDKAIAMGKHDLQANHLRLSGKKTVENFLEIYRSIIDGIN
jgi:glycosyltransferase involved in cell wall biosynthesis